MEKVTLSSKFQVVIPRAIRDELGLKPGQMIQMIPYGDRIELVPLRPVRAHRGLLRGMSSDLKRDPDRT